VVVFSGSDYQITSIRNAAFVSLIESGLANPTAAGAELVDARGSGANIFGFLLMFILMQGVVMLFLFAEDLERQQIRRIVTAPVSFSAYIAAHGLLTFASLLVPVMLLLTVVRLLGFDIGLELGEYLLLVSLLSGFSTSYGILFIAFIKDGDSANMAGSAIAVITSIVAGSFFAFTGDNYILEKLVTVLPQKALLDLAAALESGAGFAQCVPPCLYVLALTICFLAGAAWKLRRDYIKN
jgi:ABC-2 type transport system permease protein